jgi:hypothetical protein
MANDTNDRAEDPQAKPKLPTPGEIAGIGSLPTTREYLRDTMEDVKNERSGQLSPPHTPGRGR